MNRNLIRLKIKKIIRALKEDESKPYPAELVLGKRGVKYQHAVLRFKLPEGWNLKYNWVSPGIDAPDCTHSQPHYDDEDYSVFINVGLRKLLEEEIKS